MIKLRRSEERGHINLGWLESYHTFSFARYRDPTQMGFRELRVINQDRVQPGNGFPMHTHQDMEIVSYVLEGSLEHQDSTGARSVIGPGEVQVMTAGTGIAHSEYNPSPTESVHFLQIWIVPDQDGLAPRFGHRAFSPEERQGKLCPLVSPDGRDGTLTIHQDASIYTSLLDAGQQVSYPVAPGRHLWVHVAQGSALLNEQLLADGDGAAVSDEETIVLAGQSPAEVVLFDLA